MAHIPTEKTYYKGIKYMRCIKIRDGCSDRERECMQSNLFSIIQENNETDGQQVEITKVISNSSEKHKIPTILYVKFPMKK